MSRYSAIADVSQTLTEILREGLKDFVERRQEIALASPNTIGNQEDIRLTLYLYNVSENADLKNTRKHQTSVDTAKEPPLALDLYYLLTAHSISNGDRTVSGTNDQQRILGRAIQVLQDNSVLRGSVLRGSLVGGEDIHVTMYPRSIDELTGIWSTFTETPYEPSVSYLVTPVVIESEREHPIARVHTQRKDYYVEPEEQ
jgi:hypothetical protein